MADYALDEYGILHAMDKGDPPKSLCLQEVEKLIEGPEEGHRLCRLCWEILNPAAATAQRTARAKKLTPLVSPFRAARLPLRHAAPKPLPGQKAFNGAVWDGSAWVGGEG